MTDMKAKERTSKERTSYEARVEGLQPGSFSKNQQYYTSRNNPQNNLKDRTSLDAKQHRTSPDLVRGLERHHDEAPAQEAGAVRVSHEAGAVNCVQQPGSIIGGRVTKYKGRAASYAPGLDVLALGLLSIGKTAKALLFSTILAGISALIPMSANAQSIKWDGTDAPNNGTIGGGAGTWDAGTNN